MTLTLSHSSAICDTVCNVGIKITLFYANLLLFFHLDIVGLSLPGVKISAAPMRGRNSLADFWYKSMFNAPDQVCTLKHTFLKIRSDGTSSIKCCFGLHGTKVVSVLSDGEYKQIDAFLKLHKTLEKVPLSSTAAAMAAVAPANMKALLQAELQEACLEECDGSSDGSDCQTAPTPGCDDSDLDRFVAAPILNVFPDPDAISTADTQFEELIDHDSADAVRRFLVAKRSANEYRKTGEKRRRPHQQPRDWIGLACDAVRSGGFQQSLPDTIESDSSIDKFSEAGVAFPMEKTTLRGDNDKVLNAIPSYVLADRVLTVKMDCVCSFDMEFNADCQIVSMIINYIT